MPDVTTDDLDDATYDLLASRARVHGRTIEEEALAVLTATLSAGGHPDVEAVERPSNRPDPDEPSPTAG
jgi:plasmid stability protein